LFRNLDEVNYNAKQGKHQLHKISSVPGVVLGAVEDLVQPSLGAFEPPDRLIEIKTVENYYDVPILLKRQHLKRYRPALMRFSDDGFTIYTFLDDSYDADLSKPVVSALYPEVESISLDPRPFHLHIR
jgi:hypothetical protein